MCKSTVPQSKLQFQDIATNETGRGHEDAGVIE
jgi:hypothetical protein